MGTIVTSFDPGSLPGRLSMGRLMNAGIAAEGAVVALIAFPQTRSGRQAVDLTVDDAVGKPSTAIARSRRASE